MGARQKAVLQISHGKFCTMSILRIAHNKLFFFGSRLSTTAVELYLHSYSPRSHDSVMPYAKAAASLCHVCVRTGPKPSNLTRCLADNTEYIT